MKCRAATAKGDRCRRNAVAGDMFCSTHMKTHETLEETLERLEGEVKAAEDEQHEEEASGYVRNRSRWALFALDTTRTTLQLAYNQVMGEGKVWGEDQKAKPLNDSRQIAEYHFDTIFGSLTAIEELVRGAEMHEWFVGSK